MIPPLDQEKRLFPLHLSPVEKLMLADDRPEYPMAFVIQLKLTGTIDRPAFEAALDEVLERHPLLYALVRPGKRNIPSWVPSDGPRPTIDWGKEGDPVCCDRGEIINLAEEVGLRIWVRQGAGQVAVVMQFHHACSDGIGAYRFIGDLWAAYGIRTATAGQLPQLSEVDRLALRRRKAPLTNINVLTRSSRTAVKSIYEAARIFGVFGGRPVPLNKPRRGTPLGGGAPVFPGIQSHTFDKDQHHQLRNAAGRYGITVNDLLLADMFHAMRRWNEQNRSWFSGRRLRIMMPTDMRGRDDYEMPAANMMSYTFITRNASECDNPESLRLGIRNETALIKHERSGLKFTNTITAASSVRGLLPRLASSNRCLATVVHSNVGDPSRRFTAKLPRQDGRVVCGNLVLEEVTGVPPMRPKTRATFSIFSYRRELTISARCDPHLFSQEHTRELLAIYVQQLSKSLE
ncbi:MAG: hypothetical protein KDA37_18520 [Planctomycetales bacterium]|nr:hypothetical protein [Planctomycetales bacterium]